MNRDFVLEIGTEELPVRAQKNVIKQLPQIINEILTKKSLQFNNVNIFTTPCRISVFILSLASKQKLESKVVLGPPVKVSLNENNTPSASLLGFMKKMGVSFKELKKKKTPRGEYFVVVSSPKSIDTVKILPELSREIISSIPFSKTMIWNESRVRFARPIRWLFAVYGNNKLKFEYGGIKSSKFSYGLGGFRGSKVEISDAKKYINILKNNFVLLKNDERKQAIIRQIESVSKKKGIALIDEELLDEVIGLNEYPTAILGEFDETFLNLPNEIVQTVLKHHQKFFSLKNQKNNILPNFIGIKNGISEYVDTVRLGFNNVLRARLKDAEFFYNQDLKKKLRDRVDLLKKVVYQERLGSLYDKLDRMINISSVLIKNIAHDNKGEFKDNVRDIIKLSKVDLTTDIVNEFPELQGVTGRIYASKFGEKKILSDAIETHYYPRFIGDKLPKSIEASIVSLSDKLDNIISLFLLGKRPKGSKDPFAFRRQSVAIIEIIMEKKLDISLELLIDTSFNYMEKLGFKEKDMILVKANIIQFFKKRFEQWLIDKGFVFDEARSAIFVDSKEGLDCDFNDLFLRVKAIKDVRKNKDFESLIELYKRAYNIIKQAQAKKIFPRKVKVCENLFNTQEEKKLWKKLNIDFNKYGNNYKDIMSKLKDIKPELDSFFDNVMVMDKDVKLKDNRLSMLYKLVECFMKVADFSYIQNDSHH